MFKAALEIILYCAIACTFGFALIATYFCAIGKETEVEPAVTLWVVFAVFLIIGIGWAGG